MAAPAIPLIEAALGRLLVALGLTVAGGATIDQVRKRKEEADNTRTAPIARTDAQTKAKEKCKECPPDKGTQFERNTAGWSELAIQYQARIGGMPVGPGFIMEWNFNGVKFDGFVSAACLLKEAKSRYDQFFDEFGTVRDWWLKGEADMIDEAMRQGAAAVPRPPVQLHWYFMQPLSYRYFSRIIRAAYPDIQVFYQP